MVIPFGDPVPPGEEHAAGVSLPEWKHAVGFGNHDANVWDHLKTGYPRFNIHKTIVSLEESLIQWAASTPGHALAAVPQEAVKLFPSERKAKACQAFLANVESKRGGSKECVRTSHIAFSGERNEIGATKPAVGHDSPQGHIYVVTYPERLAYDAWEFWVHTGFGVSSRLCVFWTRNAPFLKKDGVSNSGKWSELLPIKESQDAAAAIRSHIAGLYSTEERHTPTEDVFLFQGGMCALTETASSLQSLAASPPGKETSYTVAIFGFLYVDTPKVLGRVLGFDCVHYGHASPEDLDAFEKELKAGRRFDLLFTEFPTNPLLRTVDVERLHALAVEFDFLVVIDDSVGNPVNLLVAPFCDIICSSLTKMYSGNLNVMGGSAVVSPWSRHRGILRDALAACHEDTYFPLDVLVMRANSSRFESRVAAASRNAEHVVELLRGHRLVEQVLYPKGSPSQRLYDRLKRPGAGYGVLMSVRFVRPSAAMAFYDALDLAKAPSFGTNFTLASPYTVLAHYTELEWAAQFGLWEHLVRISVGTEDRDVICQSLASALAAAEQQCGDEAGVLRG